MKKINRRRNHQQRVFRRRVAAYTKFLICVCALTMVISGFASKASVTPDAPKYYTEIKVGNGDTLWDIAVEYMTDEYRSINEYIHEVRELNSLCDNDIYYGQRLMIPYYAAEMK